MRERNEEGRCACLQKGDTQIIDNDPAQETGAVQPGSIPANQENIRQGVAIGEVHG